MTGMGNILAASYGIMRPTPAKKPPAMFPAAARGSKTADASKMRQTLRKGYETAPKQPLSVIDSMKQYSESLKKQRTTAENTALAKKKLKYNFKNISSKIIASRTSTAARTAVSAARREVERLKKAKRTGKYDSDEIDAAIDHAKAMERIARKKVRHLEEEETAKRCSSDEKTPPADDSAEETGDNKKTEIDKLRERAEEIEEKAEAGEFIETEEITNEMIDELCDEMEKMLDEIEELSDLMEELTAVPTDMDSEDIEALRIKHRNKEMKEITKADADYLKAVFQQYEKERSGAMGIPGMSGSQMPAMSMPESSAPAAVDIAL